MAVYEELKVFSGTAHPQLTQDVCEYLGILMGRSEAFKFSNDNTFVRILENIRQRDIFILQPLCAPVNDNVMELLITIDAAKRASAGRITAVVPYYAYGRTDSKDQPRVPITARLLADLVTVAGGGPGADARPARATDPGVLQYPRGRALRPSDPGPLLPDQGAAGAGGGRHRCRRLQASAEHGPPARYPLGYRGEAAARQ